MDKGGGGTGRPYSPDLHPIERAFAKIKHWMRIAQRQTLEDTWRHIGDSCPNYQPRQCSNYLANARLLPSYRQTLWYIAIIIRGAGLSGLIEDIYKTTTHGSLRMTDKDRNELESPAADLGSTMPTESISIPDETLKKWQTIADTMAEIVGVPAGLIMRVVADDITVLVSSRTPGNPYRVGDAEHFLGSGLFCETVITQRSHLAVRDALADPRWRNNPDTQSGMLSYLGFPILWPNNEPFGTICVLDSQENNYSDAYRRLVEQLRDLVQLHLAQVYADVARHRRNQEALRLSEERFATAFRLAPVPMAIAALEGFLLLAVNDAFLAATGYDADEAIGRDATQLWLFNSSSERNQITQKLEGSVLVRNLEMQLRAKDGRLIDCLTTADTITLNGQRCVLSVFQDITERKRTETDLIAAIEAVMRDTSWFNTSVMEKLAQIRRSPDVAARRAVLSELTPRELEVLGLLSEGKANETISKILGLSRNTVRNHLATIYDKLDVHRRSEAIIWARERGVLRYSPPKKRGKPRRSR